MAPLRSSAVSCALLLAGCLAGSEPPSGMDDKTKVGEAPPATLESISECIGLVGNGADACLDSIFSGYLADHSTKEALALLQSFENESEYVRVGCHPVAHSIGRETFKLKQTIHDSFGECDQTCHSGCYHGVMERFLGDSDGHVAFADLVKKVPTACESSLPSTLRFQCLHGLGHAVLFFTSYDLTASLELCDVSGDPWSQESCFGGVFMENIVAADRTLRDLSDTDYHYPCSTVGERYRNQCYLMQTSRMTEMGLGPSRIMEECRNAGSHTHTCQQSLGRDLSNNVRGGRARSVSMTCELGVDTEERNACTRGVVMALVDNSWDGRYALPYCPTYAAAEDVSYCFATTTSYLRTIYGKTVEQLESECNMWAPDNTACGESISR
jgi:hypothetical protein